MELGFIPLDETALVVGKHEKLALFRIPKNIDISILDGIDINFSGDELASITDENKRTYKLIKDTNSVNDIFRPIIANTITSSAVIGPQFEYCVNVIQKIPTPAASKEPIKSSAYGEHKQLDFVQVRSMPRGSTTTLSELKARQVESSQQLKRLREQQALNSKAVSSKKSKLDDNDTNAKPTKVNDSALKAHKPNKEKQQQQLSREDVSQNAVEEDSNNNAEDKKKKKKKDKSSK